MLQQQKLGSHMALAVEGIDLAQATAETQAALIGAQERNATVSASSATSDTPR